MLQDKYRIRKTKIFDRIYRNHSKFRGKSFQVLTRKNDDEHPRFGIIVSKKVGNAPIRNLIKRRIREIIRAYIPKLKSNKDFVIVTYPQIVENSFEKLERDLSKVLFLADKS